MKSYQPNARSARVERASDSSLPAEASRPTQTKRAVGYSVADIPFHSPLSESQVNRAGRVRPPLQERGAPIQRVLLVGGKPQTPADVDSANLKAEAKWIETLKSFAADKAAATSESTFASWEAAAAGNAPQTGSAAVGSSTANSGAASAADAGDEKGSMHVEMDRAAFARWKLFGKEGGGDVESKLKAAKKIIISEGYEFVVGAKVIPRNAKEFPAQLTETPGDVLYFCGLPNGQRRAQLASYLIAIGVGPGNIQSKDQDGSKSKEKIEKMLKPIINFINKDKVNLSILPLDVIYPLVNHRKDDHKYVPPFSILHQVGADIIVAQDVRNGGGRHLFISIKWAHGEIAEQIVHILADAQVTLADVNLHGVCGSLLPAIRRETMVIPQGAIHSLSPEDRDPVDVPPNASSIPGAVAVKGHGHARNLLDETDESVAGLHKKGVQTIDMESYYLARGLKARGFAGKFRMAFSVSDVATSPEENITKPGAWDEASKARHDARTAAVRKDFFNA